MVKDPANLRALHANGIVLFIDRPLEDLLVGGGRPLSTSPEALKTMEAQRRPLYLAAADAVIPNKTTPCLLYTSPSPSTTALFSPVVTRAHSRPAAPSVAEISLLKAR